MSCSVPRWLGICSARKDKLQGIEGSMLAENKVDFNNAHPVLRRGGSPVKGRTFSVSLPCSSHLKAIRRSYWVIVPLELNITVPKGHQQTKCPFLCVAVPPSLPTISVFTSPVFPGRFYPHVVEGLPSWALSILLSLEPQRLPLPPLTSVSLQPPPYGGTQAVWGP